LVGQGASLSTTKGPKVRERKREKMLKSERDIKARDEMGSKE